MKYPMSFSQHWYTTYPPPQQDTTTTKPIPHHIRTQRPAEANVEQVFSRAGQLSEVNLDPDTLADISGIDNG